MLWDKASIDAAAALGWLHPRNPLLVALLLPVAGLAVNVLVQVALLRLSRGRHFMRSLAAGFFAGGMVTLAGYPLAILQWCSVGSESGAIGRVMLEWLVLIAPAYAGLGYGYANFANLGQASIRIRLYDELRRSPDGRPLADIRRDYDETAILRSRLQRLGESGDLVRAGDLWKAGRQRFLLIGRVIVFAKHLVLRRASEFEPPTIR